MKYQSLSDKIITQPTDFSSIEPICFVKDVKQSLKEFMQNVMELECETGKDMMEVAKKIFGEKVLE